VAPELSGRPANRGASRANVSAVSFGMVSATVRSSSKAIVYPLLNVNGLASAPQLTHRIDSGPMPTLAEVIDGRAVREIEPQQGRRRESRDAAAKANPNLHDQRSGAKPDTILRLRWRRRKGRRHGRAAAAPVLLGVLPERLVERPKGHSVAIGEFTARV
jgi:hypothetical protein